MPVRRIPKNYRCVTGSFATRKMDGPILFESTLERDFLYLCEFDHRVKLIEEQLLTIEFSDPNGKKAELYAGFSGPACNRGFKLQ